MGAPSISRNRSGSGRARRAPRRAMAEINVTPFVDVMLVLLIIFMVAAPLLTVGVPVELPKTAAGALPAEDEAPLTISLQADGSVTLQTTPIPMDELIPKLRAIAAERTDDKVFLRADGAVTYDVVMQVMGRLMRGALAISGWSPKAVARPLMAGNSSVSCRPERSYLVLPMPGWCWPSLSAGLICGRKNRSIKCR